MKEKDIQNEIRLALNPYMIVFRINVGGFNTQDGRFVSTGVPRGFSDLFGVRKSDGRAVFIEVKNEKGKTSKYQDNFLSQMKKAGAIVGVARSGDEAIDIVKANI
ncbi:VRR-NUC domain-containing protein [Tissierella creatinophila]|uniref:VRR-NUC domain protein n=1 Tax=Tissierella creatinophila DSM 6911 TaxID=1123403 RepID=A0A1U7M6G7_TISCR|nr:VRR-NUC domain-containing protein [Tissierella creatinophila]OLS02897.1 VRR-NUC domain protein [Tissierella creatinophila DSM 6911]